MNGTFGSRRVTLRQEKVYPSDQDFSILLPKTEGFSVHLFALQFKRCDANGWRLSVPQLRSLRGMGHVITYCLPQPTETVAHNSLHHFFFVNPSLLPENVTSIQATQAGNIDYSPFDLRRIAIDCKLRLYASLRARLNAINAISRQVWLTSSTKSIGKQKIAALLEVVESSDVAIEAELRKQFFKIRGDTPTCAWGMQMTVAEPDSEEQPLRHALPHRSWGDFFQAVRKGARTVQVPGSQDAPPDPEDQPSPDDIRDGDGVGLTIRCPGPWGRQWAAESIRNHIQFWVERFLAPPAAVIACESFSRSTEFIEYV